MAIKNLEFEAASENDIDTIIEIINHYYNTFDNSYGFLAGRRTYSQVLEKLCDYFTAKSEGEVCGLVQISHSLPEEFETLDWYKSQYRNMLENNGEVIYIVLIAVRNGFYNCGIGKFLYNGLLKAFKGYTLFSSVIVKPYNNIHSINFHKSCGFIDVAYNSNDMIGDIRFESIYMAKFPEPAAP